MTSISKSFEPTDYLAQFREKLAAKKLSADQAWASLSRALLGANEFLYLD